MISQLSAGVEVGAAGNDDDDGCHIFTTSQIHRPARGTSRRARGCIGGPARCTWRRARVQAKGTLRRARGPARGTRRLAKGQAKGTWRLAKGPARGTLRRARGPARGTGCVAKGPARGTTFSNLHGLEHGWGGIAFKTEWLRAHINGSSLRKSEHWNVGLWPISVGTPYGCIKNCHFTNKRNVAAIYDSKACWNALNRLPRRPATHAACQHWDHTL